MQQSLMDYIHGNMHLLRKRDFLIELMTECDRIPYETNVTSRSNFYEGKLLADGATFVSVSAFSKLSASEYRIDDVVETGITVPKKGALASATSEFKLKPGALENCEKGTTTTFGRLILNYLLLAYPFGGVFNYLNNESDWNPGKIGQMLIDAVIAERVTADQLSTYVKNLYFIGHMTELSVPNYTEKSLTTDPKVKQRLAELVEQKKDALAKGDPVAMSEIEAELIEMDKAWLADDPSMDFYKKSLGKSFDVQRKKMLVTGGMVEKFGKPGQFSFLKDPLAEGISIEDFPIVCNEIRMASYSRAMETQEGGTVAKTLSRALQNASILEDDCGTKDTLPLTLKKETSNLYKNRYIVGPAGKLILLGDDNISQYIGKTLKLRSPMACKTKVGYCKKCMGQIFEVLDQQSLTMRALNFSDFLITSSLKKSHGRAFGTVDVSNLNEFVFSPK